MIDPYLVAVTLIATLLLLIGLAVVLKNRQLILHRTFFWVVTFSAIWIVSNYYSNNFTISLGAARIANHLVLFFAGMLLLFIVKFIAIISQNQFLLRHNRAISVGSYLASAITLTPLVVESISRQGEVYAIEFGALAPLYFLTLTCNALIGIWALIRGVRHSTGTDKLKIITILWSLGAMVGVNLITNAVIPFLTGSFALTNIGPFTSIILIAGLSYSILKHHLFDLRLVVARALGYTLSILTISVIYGLISFFIVNRFLFSDASLDTGQALVFITLSVFLTLTFPPIKQFFDHVTRRIFYQDAYDTEVFLDQFNKVIVSTIELEKLLHESASHIEKSIKSEFCTVGLNKTSNTPYRIIGSKHVKMTSSNIQELKTLLKDNYPSVISTDLLEDRNATLKSFLTSHNIAAVAQLTSTTLSNKSAVGYVMLGPKKSGNPYLTQDLRILEIISNELVIAIQNALRFEEIEQFNVTLQERIEEATRELRVKNRKLHELDKAKDEFISMASHQLRTPLTTVKGYLSMVLDGDTGKVNAGQRKMLDSAYFGTERMVSLISDMLNVSRISTGKFVIEPVKVNLLDIVKSEVAQLQRIADGHGVKLTARLPKTFPAVMLDENKIRQVMMNFIDNALYYTSEGGTVEVQLEAKGNALEFRVVDTGIGVSEAEKARLFTKFFRAENARQQRPDGTGLGLFMAKKVITAQGGSLIFESRLGKGSTFGFRFALSLIAPSV
jgi:signal transduction histidine kinase